MIDINELRLLVQAVIGWGCCNQAWLDQSEDTPAVVVGHINEDGETYPVVTIDCDQYYAAHHSLPLGKFYAAANPAVINELLDRLEAAESARRDDYQNWMTALDRNAELLAKLEAAEKERDEFKRECFGHISDNSSLRAKVEAMEQQEPVAWMDWNGTLYNTVSHVRASDKPLYLAPGAKGEEK